MYKLHLIKKYLLKRRIAWVALVAVMLCTAMVLVVISVMGGWLRMFQDSFHGMTGDVVVSGRSLAGFPYYQEMIDRINSQVPEVEAAVPVISTGALVNINNQIQTMVQVLGYPANIGQVNKWPQSLHLQHEEKIRMGQPPATQPSFDLLTDRIEYARLVPETVKNPEQRPGAILSAGLLEIKKDKNGNLLRHDFQYTLPVTLTLVPVAGGEQVKAEDAVTAAFWIVDDSRTKIWQYDYNTVYIPFDVAQRNLRMEPHGDQPARTNEIQMKVRDGADLMAVRDKVEGIVASVAAAHELSFFYPYRVQTWEQSQGKFIDAVKKEVVLTTMLFGIISMVAVLLIFCIFYMIVVEKTKDIGIIKSVGATGGGVMQLFLGYGLAIGVVGAGLGFTCAYLIVRYINELHDWLGRRMGVVIWDPETYQFDTIPNKMNPSTVAWILAIAVLSAVLGALVPALRAARMHPVEALRYE